MSFRDKSSILGLSAPAICDSFENDLQLVRDTAFKCNTLKQLGSHALKPYQRNHLHLLATGLVAAGVTSPCLGGIFAQLSNNLILENSNEENVQEEIIFILNKKIKRLKKLSEEIERSRILTEMNLLSTYSIPDDLSTISLRYKAMPTEILSMELDKEIDDIPMPLYDVIGMRRTISEAKEKLKVLRQRHELLKGMPNDIEELRLQRDSLRKELSETIKAIQEKS